MLIQAYEYEIEQVRHFCISANFDPISQKSAVWIAMHQDINLSDFFEWVVREKKVTEPNLVVVLDELLSRRSNPSAAVANDASLNAD